MNEPTSLFTRVGPRLVRVAPPKGNVDEHARVDRDEIKTKILPARTLSLPLLKKDCEEELCAYSSATSHSDISLLAYPGRYVHRVVTDILEPNVL